MRLLVHIEMLKAGSVRLSYGLLVAAVALSALFALLLTVARVGGGAASPISTAAGLTRVTTTSGIALLLAAVFGATLASGEFRHGTATLTYLSFPRRGRVLTAKLLTAATAGALFGALAAAAATGVGLAAAATKGDPVSLAAGALLAHIAGAALAGALLGALGVALGSIVRGQLTAIVGIVLWCLVVEPALGGGLSAAQPYLPYGAATTLAGAKLGQIAFGAGRVAPGPGPLPFAATSALIAAVVLVLTCLAALTTLRSDVT